MNMCEANRTSSYSSSAKKKKCCNYQDLCVMLHNIHNEIFCIDENKTIIQVTVADAETPKPVVSLVILWPKMVDGKVSRAERKLNSLRCILTTHQHDYQLLTHLIVLFTASISSSSLAKASTAVIAKIGEQANITLAAVQANSKADSNAAASLAFVVPKGWYSCI